MYTREVYYTHHGTRRCTKPTMVPGVYIRPWYPGCTSVHGTGWYIRLLATRGYIRLLATRVVSSVHGTRVVSSVHGTRVVYVPLRYPGVICPAQVPGC